MIKLKISMTIIFEGLSIEIVLWLVGWKILVRVVTLKFIPFLFCLSLFLVEVATLLKYCLLAVLSLLKL